MRLKECIWAKKGVSMGKQFSTLLSAALVAALCGTASARKPKCIARRNHRTAETADRLRTKHPEQHADRHHHTDCPRLRHESRRHESVALQVAHSAQGGRTVDSLHPLLEQGVCAKFLFLFRKVGRRGASKAPYALDAERSLVSV